MLLRLLDVYGDKPWTAGDTALASWMGFLNITKYPPSLLFIALTLGICLLLLRAFERRQGAACGAPRRRGFRWRRELGWLEQAKAWCGS